MATVDKDFRVKNGLVVEGSTATVNGNNIITDGDTTDVLDEGTTNQYFTDERAVDAVATAISNGTHTNITITYDDEDNSISFEGSSPIEDTDDLTEGTTNLYFTEERARNSLSGGTGITYDSETGEIAVDTEEIATREYVDEVAQGLKVRGSVEAATTADLGATYSNGTNGVDATLTIPATATLDIDGWDTWSQYDGILVKNQTNAEENGRYFIDVVGDGSTAWVLKRCVDCDTAEEIPGSFIFVNHGDTYGSTGWVATVENVDTFEVGTHDITFVQFSGAGTYSGGTGVEIDGTVIELDFTEFDTDDIDEGTTNLYYTDQRVKDVLTGSTQTNISITEVDGDLVITAENGVDDATTDDLDEGSTNLYFTDQRAIDALAGEDISLTSVAFDTVAKTFAVSGTIANADTSTQAYTFAHDEYRSAKLTVKFAYSTHTEISEVLLTMDTADNIAITEYAIVQTNGSLGTVTATLDGTNVDINVTVPNAGTVATVFGTLIA